MFPPLPGCSPPSASREHLVQDEDALDGAGGLVVAAAGDGSRRARRSLGAQAWAYAFPVAENDQGISARADSCVPHVHTPGQMAQSLIEVSKTHARKIEAEQSDEPGLPRATAPTDSPPRSEAAEMRSADRG